MRSQKKRRLPHLTWKIFILLTILAITACGGGGSGNSGVNPTGDSKAVWNQMNWDEKNWQ